ncbi:MAG: M20 family metallopeptidase [Syntrophobacteraceae bacterium]
MLPADLHIESLRTLLRDLINIYSPTGKEHEIVGFLFDYLKKEGLPVKMQQIGGGRANLLVIPPYTEIEAVLVGHVDTVAAHDLDSFGCREEDNLVAGLGAADMKGGCAAIIEAYIAYWKRGGLLPPVALALVCGEEEEGDGTRMLVKEHHFPWALIAEPSDLSPCFSHYGYVEISISTTGKRMHASLATAGQNPVEAMLRLLLRMSRYFTRDRPELVYNIRDLCSSRSGFAVPERCDVWLDVHLPPTAPQGRIMMEIEEIVIEQKREDAGFSGTLSFTNVHTGYELPHKGELAEKLKRIYQEHRLPWEPQAFRSHSDANLLWAAGIKPIILGPGSLEQAHSPHESVSFEQVMLAANIYYDLIDSLGDNTQRR